MFSGGIPHLSSADNGQNEDLLDRSIRIRKQADWSHDRWVRFLENRGWEISGFEKTFDIQRGVSDQKLDSYECTLTMKHAEPVNYTYEVFWLEWYHDYSKFTDDGELPYDNAAISFDSDHYSPTTEQDEWVVYSELSGDPDVDSKTPNGAAAYWNDNRATEPEYDREGYFGIRVDANTDFSRSDRLLYFDYVHTWSGTGLTGVSVGSGGITMQFSSDTDSWDIEDVYSEAQLRNSDQTKTG